MGKTRNIYKKKGSNKEYLKYKGKMMNVVKYKKMKTIKNKTIKTNTKTKKTKTKTKKGKKSGGDSNTPKAPLSLPDVNEHQELVENEAEELKFINAIKQIIPSTNLSKDINIDILYIIIFRTELYLRNPYRGADDSAKYIDDWRDFQDIMLKYQDINNQKKELVPGRFQLAPYRGIHIKNIVDKERNRYKNIFDKIKKRLAIEQPKILEKTTSGETTADAFREAANIVEQEWNAKKNSGWDFSSDLGAQGRYHNKFVKVPVPTPSRPTGVKGLVARLFSRRS